MKNTELKAIIKKQWDASTKKKNSKKVLLHEPTFNYKEIYEATKCLISTNVTMGKKVIDFEKNYNSLFSFRNSISCNSGSSANLLAVSAIINPDYENRLKQGDEVIVPALSWSTTIWPLIQCNLTPVFVDIDRETLNIDVNEIKKAITKKTKAIMLVHVYGNPCNMDEILKICKNYNLTLIEDCCESMGATYKKKSVGHFGTLGTFSFYFSHHITTIEGGMVVSKDDRLSELLRILRAHGWIREVKNKERYQQKDIDNKFLFVNLGYNLRLNEVQASIGNVQLKKFHSILKKRKKVAERWLEILKPFENQILFQKELKNAEHSWFGFCMSLKQIKKNQLNDFRNFLTKNGIENRPIICGNMVKQPALKKFRHRFIGELSNSNYVMNNSFSIGCHQDVTTDSQHFVYKLFKNYFGK